MWFYVTLICFCFFTEKPQKCEYTYYDFFFMSQFHLNKICLCYIMLNFIVMCLIKLTNRSRGQYSKIALAAFCGCFMRIWCIILFGCGYLLWSWTIFTVNGRFEIKTETYPHPPLPKKWWPQIGCNILLRILLRKIFGKIPL